MLGGENRNDINLFFPYAITTFSYNSISVIDSTFLTDRSIFSKKTKVKSGVVGIMDGNGKEEISIDHIMETY